MLYFGMISYADPYKDMDYGNRRESLVLTTLAVEAEDAEAALEKISDKLITLYNEDERFCDVHDFYLDDLVEVDRIGFEAESISWVSILPFGESFGQIRFLDAEGPWQRHYSLKKSSKGLPDSEFTMNAKPILTADTDEDDEGEEIPLISIDRDRRRIKPLYKELCKRKLQGTLPRFEDLSDGDLYELYVVEGCLSSEIANLFEIKKSKLDYRRRKIDATLNEEALYDLLTSLEIMDPIPYKKPHESE